MAARKIATASSARMAGRRQSCAHGRIRRHRAIKCTSSYLGFTRRKRKHGNGVDFWISVKPASTYSISEERSFVDSFIPNTKIVSIPAESTFLYFSFGFPVFQTRPHRYRFQSLRQEQRHRALQNRTPEFGWDEILSNNPPRPGTLERDTIQVPNLISFTGFQIIHDTATEV